MGILQIDQTSQRALEIFEQCYQVQIPPVATVHVDPSNPAVFGATAEESTLDIIAASLIAPNLEAIRSYQFNPRSSLVFPLAAAIGDALVPGGPQIISTSIGVCEQNLRTQALDVSEWLLSAGAAAGVTVIAAAGDTGSSSCAPANTEEASQYPATSTFVTGIGGTSFTSDQGVLSEQSGMTHPKWHRPRRSTVSVLPRPGYQRDLPGPDNRIVPDLALSLPQRPSDHPRLYHESLCATKVVGGTSATHPAWLPPWQNWPTRWRPATKSRSASLLNPRIYAYAADPTRRPCSRTSPWNQRPVHVVAVLPRRYTRVRVGSLDFAELLRYAVSDR